MSETQATPTLEGKLFLFERPELMSKEQHGGLGISRPQKPYEFCSKVRAVPITVSEVPAAMKDYPIVFMAQDNLVPLAVVGLGDDVNLFVDDEGNWEANRYIPGYVRRYPFGLAGETGGDRMAIVIDGAFEGLSVGGDMPLFENGEPTASTQQAIEFCKTFERDRQMTEEFGRQLAPFDLVQGQTAQYTPANATEPQAFAQYFAVDEQRLNGLSDDQYLEMRKSGMLAIVYAMVMSLGNWRMLLERRARRFGLTDAQVAAPSIVN